MDKHFRAMTFNIRMDTEEDGPNAWIYRKDRVAGMFRFHRVDIVGVQEAFYHQVTDMASALEDYSWIGVGREDGKRQGEFAAIFYKKDRFKLLDQGTFWLSETPDTAGSMGWDAACTRITTWGRFEDKITGDTFCYYNVHFDHVGQLAVIESAHLLADKITELAGDQPVILGGDLNTTATSECYRILTAGQLKDAQSIALTDHHGPTFTFHDFEGVEKIVEASKKATQKPSELLMAIDFLFVTEHIQVLNHGTLADQWNGMYPSDHMPVVSDVRLRFNVQKQKV